LTFTKISAIINVLINKAHIMAKKHLMVDLETMAVTPRTVVLTLGAVTFDPFSNDIY